mgnify:CR=1 FL=1
MTGIEKQRDVGFTEFVRVFSDGKVEGAFPWSLPMQTYVYAQSGYVLLPADAGVAEQLLHVEQAIEHAFTQLRPIELARRLDRPRAHERVRIPLVVVEGHEQQLVRRGIEVGSERRALPQQLDQLKPAKARHDQVRDHDIRLQPFRHPRG